MVILMRKDHPLMKPINSTIMDMPVPLNISFMWNYGSILGMILMFQIMSGLFLSFHYIPDTILAFDSISKIMHSINYGWIIRYTHANGATFFFFFIYMHLFRNLYFNSYKMQFTWNSGVIILLTLMGTAFVGYILPWGQMSFWGTTVITNLLSVVPYIGETLIQWIWGDFSVNKPTLNRFYSFHFVLPFIMLALVMVHIIFLHETGSSNPLGMTINTDKIPFNQYYWWKDLLGFSIIILTLILVSCINPNLFTDPENFCKANPLVTPPHIQPEWYFLFAYAILRSIPNKLGGVIALAMSVFIYFFIPFMLTSKTKSSSFFPLNKILFWMFLFTFTLLTWAGSCPVEDPFISMGKILSLMYFVYFFLFPILMHLWNKMLN
uniref:cytochrome b n=1 Tax=Spelaeomysis bottazzii TaxID=2970448 RepID=UPI002176961E|nr:cytochrome b [Spelaeomysis bottazzii]UUL70724.1 cytochrome b [Spelaeomysis bottazzii]